MNITINENFEEYRREFWKGLTLRQTIHAVGGVASGVAAYCVSTFLFNVPSDIGIWLALPASLPIVVPGFVRIQGMSLMEWLKRMSEVRGATYTYKSEFLLEQEEFQRRKKGVSEGDGGKSDKDRQPSDKKKVCFEAPEEILEILEDSPGIG